MENEQDLSAGQDGAIEMSDADMEAAFNEGAGIDDGAAGNDDDGNDGAGDNAGGEQGGNDSAGTDDGSGEGEGQKPPTLEELRAENERLKKIAEDNQKFARAEAEKADKLEKEMAVKKAAEDAQKDPFADADPAVKEYLQDNPEVKTIAEKLAESIIAKKFGGVDPSQISQQLQQMNGVIQQMNFTNAITAGYVDDTGAQVPGHPDAQMIIRGDDFKAFVEEKKANVESITAAEAINLISDFKKVKAAKGAAEHDTRGEGARKREQAKECAGAAGGSIGTGTKPAEGKKGASGGSEEDWFNEGAQEEARKMKV